jgi:hypothetical protein
MKTISKGLYIGIAAAFIAGCSAAPRHEAPYVPMVEYRQPAAYSISHTAAPTALPEILGANGSSRLAPASYSTPIATPDPVLSVLDPYRHMGVDDMTSANVNKKLCIKNDNIMKGSQNPDSVFLGMSGYNNYVEASLMNLDPMILDTLESRVAPALELCGTILDENVVMYPHKTLRVFHLDGDYLIVNGRPYSLK